MQYGIEDLIYLMARLRTEPGGCPWDLEQTAKTIINYSLEEVYELADAIERGDSSAEKDELGDVLFQVVFLARLAEEKQQYDFTAVVQGLCEKLVRRHPHVFVHGQLYPGEGTFAGSSSAIDGKPIDAKTVATNWEAIKRSERQSKQMNGLFADVPRSLPALYRARKLQKRATFMGLDWPDVEGALASLAKELEELRQAINNPGGKENAQTTESSRLSQGPAPVQSPDHSQGRESSSSEIANELGDVLFSCVNVARKLGLNPEQCLRQANMRFMQRVEFVAERLPSTQLEPDQPNLPDSELDELWKLAKKTLC